MYPSIQKLTQPTKSMLCQGKPRCVYGLCLWCCRCRDGTAFHLGPHSRRPGLVAMARHSTVHMQGSLWVGFPCLPNASSGALGFSRLLCAADGAGPPFQPLAKPHGTPTARAQPAVQQHTALRASSRPLGGAEGAHLRSTADEQNLLQQHLCPVAEGRGAHSRPGHEITLQEASSAAPPRRLLWAAGEGAGKANTAH